MISNSGHDENGQYSGGAAGDQTGNEWSIIPWYNRPWNVVLRFEDSTIAEMIATLATEAANNDLIGYDQNQRWTFWNALKSSGFRPKNITTACEADCSAGVLAICKAVGYLLNNTKMMNINSDGYTGTERRILVNAGAIALTNSKFTASDYYLCRGDILLYEGAHTAINLTDGAGVPAKETEVTDVKMPGIKNGSTGHAVYVWQAILGFSGDDYDGQFGDYTEKKTIEFQKKAFPDDSDEWDGLVGDKTWKAGLESV